MYVIGCGTVVGVDVLYSRDCGALFVLPTTWRELTESCERGADYCSNPTLLEFSSCPARLTSLASDTAR